MAQPKHPADSSTDDELWRIYETLPKGVRADIIGEMIYVQSSPKTPHQHVNLRLARYLDSTGDPNDPWKGAPGWWILHTPGYRYLDNKEVTPDIGGWRKERLPNRPDIMRDAPDWVCEVLSKDSTEHYDKGDKTTLYAQYAIPWIWYADPILQTIEVVKLNAYGSYETLTIVTGSTEQVIQPFDSTVIPLQYVW